MYEIIDKKPISTQILLNELMKENNISGLKLANDLHLQERTVSYWRNGRSTIRKSNIKMLADYFNVDEDYLLCKQVEKKKTNFKEFDEHIVSQSFQKDLINFEAFTRLLENNGFSFHYTLTTSHKEEIQFIDNGYLYTYLVDIPDDEKIFINFKNEEIEMSNAEFNKIINKIILLTEIELKSMK